MKRPLLRHVCRYALGLAVLAWVVWRTWSRPEGGGPSLAGPILVGPLLLAVALCLAGLLLLFVRWHVLVRAQGLAFTLRDALRLGSIGLFLGTFLPGSVAGDAVKAALLARRQSRRTVAVTTVLADRAIGLWGLFWVVTLVGGTAWVLGDPALSAEGGLRPILVGASAVVAGTLGLWVLLTALPARWVERTGERLARLPQVGPSAAELWGAVWLYRRRARCLAAALLLSLASQACFVLTFSCAAQALLGPAPTGAIPTVKEHFVLVPVGETVQVFFPSPGGVGGAEYSYGKLYLLAGSPETSGVLAALGYRAILWGCYLVGFLVSVLLLPEGKGGIQEGKGQEGKENIKDYPLNLGEKKGAGSH